ncbi:MAG TPA: DNA double-strand break repair nuclease NurA, partial [Pyrodictium sp.]|nr:DNA double-strand break repair nuclease NurA [Pyrodictium sp.]
LIGIVAGYHIFNARKDDNIKCRGVFARLFFVDSEEARKKIPLAAKLLEKKVGIRLLGMVSDRKLDIAMLLLDGEIIPYQLLFKSHKTISSSRLLYRLDTAVTKFLKMARENNIVVVGVVKRSYSHLTSILHGRLLPLNDKALMSIILKRQEYMVLGKFRDILPTYARILASEGRAPSKLPQIVAERLDARPEYGGVVVAFYKPSIAVSYNQAVRIEVYGVNSENELERVVALLDGMTNPATGLPAPVDLIDELIRFESRSLELVRRRIVSELVTRLGPTITTLLSHTNPEKRYLYEPRRRV